MYEFNSMPIGFKNSPAVMARVMSKILCGLCYIDDIIINSEDEKTHIS